MLALVDLFSNEHHMSHTAILRAPLARLFALIPAIEERHGAESGRGFVSRQVARAMRETEEWLLENYAIT